MEAHFCQDNKRNVIIICIIIISTSTYTNIILFFLDTSIFIFIFPNLSSVFQFLSELAFHGCLCGMEFIIIQTKFSAFSAEYVAINCDKSFII